LQADPTSPKVVGKSKSSGALLKKVKVSSKTLEGVRACILASHSMAHLRALGQFATQMGEDFLSRTPLTCTNLRAEGEEEADEEAQEAGSQAGAVG
jgi:hypothetical protein